jgi:drug/metabolite transporter (DMT)-like permease
MKGGYARIAKAMGMTSRHDERLIRAESDRSKCIDERPLALSMALNIFFLLTGLVASTVIALWAPETTLVNANPFLFGHWSAMGVREWQVIAMLAILIVAVSSGVAKAYQSAPPAIIATFDYSYLAFAAFWSFAIFSDLPDTPTIAGLILITASGLLVIVRPSGHRRSTSASGEVA